MKNHLRYFYALLAVPVMVLLRYALMPLIGPGVPYVTLFPVSVGVAMLAGLGPAILTGILGSIVVDFFFIPPLYELDFTTVEGISRIAIVTLTSAFVGYVGQVLREARARAEKQAIALRESQTDLNRAQAVANTGSWRLDVLRNELTWSDEAYRIFGVPTGTALTYESFLSYIHPDDREYVDTKWQASLGGEKYDIEHRIIVGDTIKWVREKAELEFDPQGVLLGGFGTVTDITERKKMEDALRQARDELELRIQERTAQLSHTVNTLEEEVRQRILAEEVVLERSRMLDAFFEHTITPLVILDREFNFIRVNEAYARSCQKKVEDFPGHNHFEFYPHAENQAIFEGVVRTKTPYVAVAKPFSFPDHPEWGITYWDWTLTPLLDDKGEVEYLVFALEDVTQRKRAEIRDNVTNTLLELFAQKASKQEYLDSVVKVIHNWSGCRSVGIRLLNSEGYIPYASYVGFSEEFLKLENMLSIKKDICACIRVITGSAEPPDAAVMTSKGSFRLDNSNEFLNNLTEKEKSLFRGNCVYSGFVSIAVVPVRYREEIIGAIHLTDENVNKVPLQNIEFIENISPLIGEAVHRFDTETELRESEERYRQLVELSPDGISVEIDNKIAFINTAGAKLLGGTGPEQFIGRSIADFMRPGYVRLFQRQIEYFRKQEKKMPQREEKFIRLDGKAFDVEVAATLLVYKNKPAAQIVFRDITERKAAEEEILANQKQLRSLTAELVLTEERERRIIAAELHDSLGPILSFSKRELGTLQKSVSAKTADVLKNVSNNISEAIKQTRNLTFDLSPPALYTFGFEMAVAELAERFCEDQKLQIIFENSDEPKPLSNHSKILLYRSIREILINIIKHAKAKVVNVALSRVDESIKIVVKDDGEGFNVSGLYSKPGGAIGFGLFSVRERLTHIGGVFDIQSGKGKGTTVTLLAPLELNGVSHPLQEKD